MNQSVQSLLDAISFRAVLDEDGILTVNTDDSMSGLMRISTFRDGSELDWDSHFIRDDHEFSTEVDVLPGDSILLSFGIEDGPNQSGFFYVEEDGTLTERTYSPFITRVEAEDSTEISFTVVVTNPYMVYILLDSSANPNTSGRVEYSAQTSLGVSAGTSTLSGGVGSISNSKIDLSEKVTLKLTVSHGELSTTASVSITGDLIDDVADADIKEAIAIHTPDKLYDKHHVDFKATSFGKDRVTVRSSDERIQRVDVALFRNGEQVNFADNERFDHNFGSALVKLDENILPGDEIYVYVSDDMIGGSILGGKTYTVDDFNSLNEVYYEAKSAYVDNGSNSYRLIFEDPYSMYVVRDVPFPASMNSVIFRPSDPIPRFMMYGLDKGVVYRTFTIFDGLKVGDSIDFEMSSEQGVSASKLDVTSEFTVTSEEDAMLSREVAWGIREDVEDDPVVDDNSDIDEPVDDVPVEDNPIVEDLLENDPVDDIPDVDELPEDDELPVDDVPVDDVPVVDDTPVADDLPLDDIPFDDGTGGVVTDESGGDIVLGNVSTSDVSEDAVSDDIPDDEGSQFAGDSTEGAETASTSTNSSDETLPQTGASITGIASAVAFGAVSLGAAVVKKKRN